jgi:hypothetical protein
MTSPEIPTADRTADTALTQLEWARDCYERGLGQAVEDQIAYLRRLNEAPRTYVCAQCRTTRADDGFQPQGWVHTMDGRNLCGDCHTGI